MTELLDHPETRDLFETLLRTLIGESDRGAVLVGTAHVDKQLRDLFEAVISKGMSNKRRKSLLSYPGPLGTASAKVEVAYAMRLIPESLYQAIHALRHVRNDVAHNPDSFSLLRQQDRVRQMYDLGPGVAGGLREIAMRMLLDYKAHVAIETMKELQQNRDDSAMIQMATRADFAEFISQRPEIIENLENQLPQWQLALGISVICGWLILCRDESVRVLGEDQLIMALAREGQGSTEDDDE